MRKSAFHLMALAVCAVLSLSACSTSTGPTRKTPTYEDAANNPLVPANYRAAEALLAQLQGRLSAGQPLIVATLVNIDALERSSTLGRLSSEHVAARFTQAGHRVVEMKFRNSVYVLRDQGELMLSRDIREIASSHDAQAVIVGTYGESSNYVFINLKVIEPQSNVTLAVHDYALPIDTNTRALLRSNR